MEPGAGKQDGLPLPRWALWLMLPGIVAPLLIFVFILFTESAHDVERCPFREVERRALAANANAIVVEDGRNCLGDIEERRFRLLRGSQERLLGERRFDAADFAPGRYRWDAVVSPKGEVQVTVHNEGHPDLLLREGTAEERAKGISR